MAAFQNRNGLSPYGPHVSEAPLSLWSCDGIDPFAFSGSWTCYGILNNCICNDFSCPHSCTFFNRSLAKKESNTWLRGRGCTSSGRDTLIEDCDWLDLERDLSSILGTTKQDTTLECTVVDSNGKRDITANAIHFEVQRFSGVIRLRTLLEIFQIDNFKRKIEFFDCLRCHCSLARDPKFGVMVVLKKHLYIPARKIDEIQKERALNMDRKKSSKRTPSLPKVVVIDHKTQHAKQSSTRANNSKVRSPLDATQSSKKRCNGKKRPVLQDIKRIAPNQQIKQVSTWRSSLKKPDADASWTLVASPKSRDPSKNLWVPASPKISTTRKSKVSSGERQGKDDMWRAISVTKSASCKASSPKSRSNPPSDRTRLAWRGVTMVL